MISTAILLTSLTFSNPIACDAHMNEVIPGINADAITLRTKLHITAMQQQRIIELYGAHAILRCSNNQYTAYILEEKQ